MYFSFLKTNSKNFYLQLASKKNKNQFCDVVINII